MIVIQVVPEPTENAAPGSLQSTDTAGPHERDAAAGLQLGRHECLCALVERARDEAQVVAGEGDIG